MEAGEGIILPFRENDEPGGYTAVGSSDPQSVSHRTSRSNTIEMRQHFEEEVEYDLRMQSEASAHSVRSHRSRASSVAPGGAEAANEVPFATERDRSATLLSCDIGWVIDREAAAQLEAMETLEEELEEEP